MDIKHLIEHSSLKIAKEKIKYDEPMKLHTSFKVGGPAECYIKIESYKELKDILDFANENNMALVKKLDASGTDIFFTDGIKEVGFTHQRFGNLENYGAKNLLIADFSKYSEQTLQNVSTALKKVQQVWKDAFKNA